MKIIDINGCEREISSIERISHNRRTESIACKHEVKDGELSEFGEEMVVDVNEEYAKVTIIGRSGREWIEFYPLEEFEKRNPNIRI